MAFSFVKPTISLAIILSLSACANMSFSNRTIHQGNLSVQSASQKLKLGMSKSEVAKLMGNSLVTPVFESDRWDYALTTQKPRQEVSIKTLSLQFKQDRLVQVDKHA